MDIAAVQTLVKPDMQAVNELILQRLHSNVALVNQIGYYIVNSGGKRLRPIMVLLSANAFRATLNPPAETQHHLLLAAVIEFIHTATLLHDDVVDASELRRGKQTANNIWGNEASVLVGDFLYSRAFQMMVEVQNMRVMDILSYATNIIAEGEVLQLLNCHDPDTTEEAYMQVIHCKTAKLFEAATQLGAVITHQPPEIEQAMANYGMHVGTAFQLVDDVLDYSSTAEEIGKNVGDDLAEGKPTLPLIHALRNSQPEQQAILRHIIKEGGREDIGQVLTAIASTNALDYTLNVAKREAQKAIDALSILPPSTYVDAMRTLAHFSVNRSY